MAISSRSVNFLKASSIAWVGVSPADTKADKKQEGKTVAFVSTTIVQDSSLVKGKRTRIDNKVIGTVRWLIVSHTC